MTGPVYTCARCGADLGNGAVAECAVIHDVEPGDPQRTRVLRLCRDRTADDGSRIQGCRDRVLTRRALRHHLAEQEATRS